MMNDSELLELIRERDPDDLTVEECDALRAAVRRSPALLREAADRIRLDIDYVERWSPLIDTVLLLRTIKAVITGTGAH